MIFLLSSQINQFQKASFSELERVRIEEKILSLSGIWENIREMKLLEKFQDSVQQSLTRMKENEEFPCGRLQNHEKTMDANRQRDKKYKRQG